MSDLIVGLCVVLLLSGCKCEGWQPNQEKRHAYFVECMNLVNAHRQPEHNHEDNNGHIISECESTAYYQSMERKEQSCP